VYMVEEFCGWFDDTKWRFIRRAPFAGPQSLVVAEAP
jgi:hypothetical protein